MDLNHEYKFDVDLRLKLVIWIIAVFFMVVGVRLFYLQVMKGDYYRMFSDNNSIKDLNIFAPRGIIYDKNGVVLADNRPVFDLVVIPQYISNSEELISSLSGVLGFDADLVRTELEKAKVYPPYRPYLLRSDVGIDTVSKLKVRQLPFGRSSDYNLDGVDVLYRYVRDYPDGLMASHLLGYVREIDKDKLEKVSALRPGIYEQGDSVGIGGIEEVYDLELRGEKGRTQKIVDALGREVSNFSVSFELIDAEPVDGQNIYLTIDAELQKKAKEMLEGKTGAIVALDPETGAVLAMYSSPSYDLTKMYETGSNNYWSGLVTDSEKPLYNRFLQGTYPPASTYKIVTALAALSAGVVSKKDKVSCGGGLTFGNRRFGCWKSGGHGSMSIVEAIRSSCDVFFYTMGLRLGVDKLAEYATKLGFGSVTGFELPGEKSGLVPTSAWKLKKRGAVWQKSEDLSVAIGQGYDLVTPLQVALMGAEIANGGYKIIPHIVDHVQSDDGKVVYRWDGKKEKIEGISAENIEIVKEGLIAVVEKDGGTARSLQSLGLKIAGKTGTAQVVSKTNEGSKVEHKSHAWFVGFAPYDAPRIAVAAIVEHGMHGSSAAAPIVGQIIKSYIGEH